MWKFEFDEGRELYRVFWSEIASSAPAGRNRPRVTGEEEWHSECRSARRAVFRREAEALGVGIRGSTRYTAADERYDYEDGFGIGDAPVAVEAA